MSHDLVLDEFHHQWYSNVKAYCFIVLQSLVAVVHGTLKICKNFNLSLLQIGAKLYHKLENFLLPIGASVNTNWGKRYYKLGQIHFITNWGKCYDKLVQLFLFQIGASVITNWASLIITKWGRRYSKLGQLLQIRATVITNCGSYYKLG